MRELRKEVAYLRDQNLLLRRRCDISASEIDKMAEHISIQNGMIQRAREILDRQRIAVAQGNF